VQLINNVLKLVFFGAVIMSTACSNLNYSATTQILKRYDLHLPQSLEKKLDPNGPSLLIYPVQSNNLSNSTRIAYSLKKFEVSYYSQNVWIDTPAHLLTPLVISNMENSNLFGAVVRSGSSAITDLALYTELLTLIHEYEDDKSKILLSMRMQLIDLRKRNVIASETLNIEEVAISNDPYGAVVATNAAVNKLMPLMQKFVSQSIKPESISLTP